MGLGTIYRWKQTHTHTQVDAFSCLSNFFLTSESKNKQNLSKIGPTDLLFVQHLSDKVILLQSDRQTINSTDDITSAALRSDRRSAHLKVKTDERL